MSEKASQSEDQQKPEVETEKLSAIRDIIFGNEIQEYNKEFNEIKTIVDGNKNEAAKNLEKTQSELSAKIDRLQQTVDERFMALETNINKKLDALDDAKSDRRKLGDLLESIAKQLKS